MTVEAYGQFAYCYDRLMADHPYDEWMRFVTWCWDAYGKPETVVDLGCGTGTLTLMLAETGCRVTGIDVSDDMLAVAQEKRAGTIGNELGGMIGGVNWLQQDMRAWELPEPVDCVVSFCDCLNYLLEEEDITRVFSRTIHGLKQGGLFLFDVHTPRQLQAYAANQPFLLDEDDIAYIWTCDYDEDRLQIEHELTIFAAERSARTERAQLFRRFEETHIQRAYPLDWLKHELERAGFCRIGCFADFTREPADEQRAGRAFFAAHKP
jgi:SAM-dependent methyltransferase